MYNLCLHVTGVADFWVGNNKLSAAFLFEHPTSALPMFLSRLRHGTFGLTVLSVSVRSAQLFYARALFHRNILRDASTHLTYVTNNSRQ